MVGSHTDSNVYKIKPVNGKGQVWVVNQCDLQDLGYTHEEEDSSGSESNKGGPEVPSFTPGMWINKTPQSSHP